VDLDGFVAAHRGQWDRLAELSARRRLSAREADELLDLYERTATHLSMVQAQAPDPALVTRLSGLVARSRSAVTGASSPSWANVVNFFGVSFPAALYRTRFWWIGTALVSTALATAIGVWVASNPSVQSALGTPDEISQLVNDDFVNYYSSNPAGAWAFQLWVNNAWVAATALTLGAFLCLPGAYVLLQNAVNVGIAGGLMASADRLDVFFGLIAPHGMLELTGVFIAGGVGIRLGWQIVDPGPRPRLVALAEEGRATFGIAVGLIPVFLMAGLIEAFVTPSPLPTWARVGIGFVVWSLFMVWVFVPGRRAVQAGRTGDVELASARTDFLPYAG